MNDQPTKIVHKSLQGSVLVVIATLFLPLLAAFMGAAHYVGGYTGSGDPLRMMGYSIYYVLLSPIWIYLIVVLLRLPKYNRSAYRLAVVITLIAGFLLGIQEFGWSLTVSPDESYLYYDLTSLYALFFFANAMVFIFLLSIEKYFPVPQKTK